MEPAIQTRGMEPRKDEFWASSRPSGSHHERVLTRISPAQSVYRMIEVTSGKKPVAHRNRYNFGTFEEREFRWVSV